MANITCDVCGKLNEPTNEVCNACGSSLFSAVDTITLTGDENRPKAINPVREPDGAFGFGSSDLAFVRQGVSTNAAQYLQERFRPISPISKGGMGKLFLVQEVLSGRFVALKVMLERASKQLPYIHQFIREAVITARLQHPHIIPVHELGFLTEGQLYYTMRYIDGHTFDEVAPKIDLEERLRILRSAAMAVDYAHSQGLWHRDLKPNNILVGPLGDTYVIDWGLVTVQPGHDYHLNLPRMILERDIYVMPDKLLDDTREAVSTMTGNIVGTPAYMSPEQFTSEDNHMGCISDVWAFGIMLFEAITGRHPIENVHILGPNQIMRRVLGNTLPSPKELSEDVSSDLDNLCQRMLNKDRKERLPNLKYFIEELTHFLKHQGKTIAEFGTFSQLPKTEIEKKPDAMKTTRPIKRTDIADDLQRIDTNHYSDYERLHRKVELLIEISQLGIFSSKRRKKLWGDLARL